MIRSVRQDSRIVAHHLMRAGMATVILYLFFMQWEFARLRVGAGGLFASEVMYSCYWFLTLVGGIHFSTAIVEEKEEQTLPLLRMTGASAFAILAGKSIPRLAVAILFLFAVAPFLILSISLGGVLPLGLVGAILSVVCYAVMLSQIGLFASVVSRNSMAAFTLTCVLWSAVELSHWWLGLFDEISGMGLGLYDWQSQSVLVANLGQTLLAFTPSDLWFPHMTFHLWVAAIAFAASWLLFEPFTSGTAGEAVVEPPNVRSRAASRVWTDAAAWKSWEHLGGGWKWFGIRAVAGTLSCVTVSLILLLAIGSQMEWIALAWTTFVVGIAFLLINVCRLGGQVFNSEIHQKTLASLAMLPQPLGKTLRSTVFGLFPAVVASAIAVILSGGCLLLYAAAQGDLDEVFEVFVEPWFLHLFSWILLTLHVGVLLSTHFRHGGMLVAVALLWLAAPIFCGMSVGVLAMTGVGEDLFRFLLPMTMILGELVGCIVIQRSIVRRLQQLAGQ
ncbi:MAG: ABC transporter permease subunit [Planctomycetaceae bacterium]